MYQDRGTTTQAHKYTFVNRLCLQSHSEFNNLLVKANKYYIIKTQYEKSRDIVKIQLLMNSVFCVLQ